MCATSRKPEFTVTAEQIVAIGADGVHYVWTYGAESWEQKQAARETYEKANPGANVVSLNGVCADYDTDHAYLFFVADCFSPPLYLVFGRSFEDAHETFVTEFESLVKIEESDLADYGDDYHVNDNGTPVDTESVQYVAVRELVARDSSKGN